MACIGDDIMTTEAAPAVVCRRSPDGSGWVCTGVAGLAGRRLTRNSAITAMVLAERLAAGFGDGDPFIDGWRAELGIGLHGSPGAD